MSKRSEERVLTLLEQPVYTGSMDGTATNLARPRCVAPLQAQGPTRVSDHPFIKLSVVVRDCLHPLKGAPLSTFLALAVNEAEMSLGASRGLSAHDLAAQTGYGLRTTHYALEYLCQHHYVTKLEVGGERGESRYRVCAYAWFGNPPQRHRCA